MSDTIKGFGNYGDEGNLLIFNAHANNNYDICVCVDDNHGGGECVSISIEGAKIAIGLLRETIIVKEAHPDKPNQVRGE